jgi:phage terminase large subunit-like protein
VYNLSVDEVHEYYANGILTHNCDEAAAWRYSDAYDQAIMGLRLGTDPQMIVTTTPRPLPWIKELAKQPGTIVTKGKTLDNTSNLAPTFITKLLKKYEGTRLGRQELEAEILDDAPGALWKRSVIDPCRVSVAPVLLRTVVAVDPAVTNSEESDETGIVVVGIGHDGHGYVLEDASGKYDVSEWTTKVDQLFKKHSCEAIVVEVNQGGDLVKSVMFNVNGLLPIKEVRASKGKIARAEPVALVYEQLRVHHVGNLGVLEDQLCSFDPTVVKKSPDRLDALVWGFTHLMVNEPASGTNMIERDGWRPWVAKAPACTDVIMALHATADKEVNGRFTASATVWGLFHAPQDKEGELSAIVIGHKAVNGYLADIGDAIIELRKSNHITRVHIAAGGGINTFLGGYIRRTLNMQRREVPYEPAAGPGLAAQLVKEGRVFYPSGKAWSGKMIMDLKRFPHGDTQDLAHSVGIALVYLRHYSRLRLLDEAPEQDDELRLKEGIYG